MADDISKNITIQVSAQTEQLEKSITNLNSIINNLLIQQKQLIDSGNQTSTAFQNNADKIDIFQKSLQNASSQLNSYLSILNSSATSLQKNQSLITALTAASDKYSKTVGDNSKKVTELNAAINALSSTTQQQQTKATQSQSATNKNNKSLADGAKQAKSLKSGLSSVSDALNKQQSSASNSKSAHDSNTKSLSNSAKQAKSLKSGLSGLSGTLNKQPSALGKSKKAFDTHKTTMDHLKTSFDEIKGVSGEFGPSLQDAAKGFSAMKSGLSIVQGGLKGIGEAIEADGFSFLLQILQYLFTAFVQSSTGSKILQGAISAIGVIISKVQGFIDDFKTAFLDALSHPIESIKALGKMVEQNIINRFNAFGVILDGIIHLDFKKMANGALQAFSGVTDATDKIGTAFNTVKQGVKDTATEMVNSYNTGFDQAGQTVANHETNTDASIDRQIAKYDALGEKIGEVYGKCDNRQPKKKDQPKTSERGQPITAAKSNSTLNIDDSDNIGGTIPEVKIAKNTADQVVTIKKTALQQIEDEAKKSAGTIAANALNTLKNSIKQQSDAKIAGLEKDKAAELNNTTLTSAQRIAIQQKYKTQEDQVKAKAFKEEQEASIAQAIINGALAITKGTAQTGILATLYVPTIIAETAVQVAKISAQKPPAYASGGLHYTSDGRGGVLPGYSRTDNTNAYLRSGEGIVVSEAMRDPWARNLVSAINVGFGGRDFSTISTSRGFAVGGVFTDGGDANRYYNQPVNDQKNLANTIAYQMVNNFPPVYVDVKDINHQQNILAQTINRVNL